MNQTQRKYARERVEAIASRARENVQKHYTTPGNSLSATERFKEFKAGRFKIKKGVDSVNTYTDVCDIVEFDKETKTKKNTVKIQKETEQINTALNKVIDEIMLGDNEKALKLIEAFDKKYS